MIYRVTGGARPGRTWPTLRAPGKRTAAGDALVDCGRRVRWAGLGSEGADAGRSVAPPRPASLAAVDAMVKHYADVADPRSLHIVVDTLLGGGWNPVIIVARGADGLLHVVGPPDLQLVRVTLMRALNVVKRAS